MRWERQGRQYSHWTIALFNNRFFICLFLITLFHLWLAIYLPPFYDELQYWHLSKNLELIKEPPLFYFLINIFTYFCGDSIFVIRLPSIILSFSTVFILSTLIKRHILLLFIIFCPVYFFFGMIARNEVLFIFFWTCYLLWTIKLNQKFDIWQRDPVTRVYNKNPVSILTWILGGIILALGIMTNLYMLIAIPTLILLLLVYRFSAYIKGVLVHLLSCFIVLLPFLIKAGIFDPFSFLNWLSLGKTKFSEFVFYQILLFGGMLIIFVPWVIVSGRRLRFIPSLRTCYFFSICPLFLFCVKLFISYVSSASFVFIYIAFFPLSEFLVDRFTIKPTIHLILVICFLPSILTTLISMVHLVYPIKYVPIDKDYVNIYRSYVDVATLIENDLRLFSADGSLFTDVNKLEPYLHLQKVKIENLSKICSHNATFFLTKSLDLKGCFTKYKTLRQYEIKVRNLVINKIMLLKLRK